MNAPSLQRQLLSVGRAAAKGSEGNRLRFAALLCATLALAVGFVFLVAGFATYDGRELRGSARAPHYLGEDQEDRATSLWRQSFDTVGGLQHSVVFIEPLREDAELPPGVEAWPAPGEAVLSPELRAALVRENAVDRYGNAVGVLGEDGLEVPGERLAYVRPTTTALAPDSMFRISGYGGESRAAVGDELRVQNLSAFVPTVMGFLLLPACALVVIAARSGAAARDRRAALLRALGAGYRARALVNLGEAALAVATGVVAAAALAGSLLVWNVRVPVVGYTVSAADASRWAPELFGSVLLAGCVVLCAVVFLHRVEKGTRSTRPGHHAGRNPRWAAWLCPVLLLVAVRGPGLAGGAEANPLVFLAVYSTGVIGTLATLPAVIALAVAGVGRLLVRHGNRHGRPGPLIAGRWNIARPGVTTRMVASVVIAIGLVAQVQLWSSRLNEPMLEAQATYARIGDSAVTMWSLADTPERTETFLKELPEGVHGLGMHRSPADGGMELRGSCEALRALDAPCDAGPAPRNDPRLQEVAAWYGAGGSGITVREGAVSADHAVPEALLLVSAQGGDLPVSEVKHTAFRQLLGPQAESLGGSWLTGARQLEKPAAWVLLLGLAGVVLLTVTAALNNLGEFLRFSRNLAPVSVLTGRRTVFFTTALWVILMPLALAGLLGTLVAVWLGTPLTQPGGGASLSWPILTATLIVVETLAVAFWWWGGTAASRAAAQWRPQAD
ncbi:hypothetical protein GCM10009716_21770 [Streptomyces sodiiphilus]|uniref:ABC transporter permease n=1 Tax=Streptomyces sodiiphilus TaxID=226217 RepID=A0ABN2P3C9_9ACTN